jgi:hypothetical protein
MRISRYLGSWADGVRAPGIVLGALIALLFFQLLGAGDGTSGRIIRQAMADLEEGEYEFFPNRRSIWIVNRSNGRMANYYFNDDELGSVDRSRVAQLDLKTFPRKDTVLHLSDRNYNNILWVCNTRTGDVQMWHPGRDGVLRAEQPITSSIDLMER